MTASAVAAVTDRERSLLEAITETSRTENAAAARLIAQIMDYTNSRGTFEHRAPGAGFDTEQAERSAIAEIALALSSTYRSVSSLMRLGFTLERMPQVRGAAAAGEVSLAKIRVIDEHTRKATTAAMLRLDTAIAAAATRLAPTPLGIEIDRLLIEDDAAWAQRARERAEATRKVRSHRLPHGMGVLSVTLTATQLTAVTGMIVKVAKTVCRADPRPLDVRCADAFLAVIGGRRILACECGDPECAATRNPTPAQPQVHLNLMCGLETLLGLADNPGYLEGYGYLDAGQTRTLAGDATWQAIIDCATKALEWLSNQDGINTATAADSLDRPEGNNADAEADTAASVDTDESVETNADTDIDVDSDSDTDGDTDGDAADGHAHNAAINNGNGVTESVQESRTATESPSDVQETDTARNDGDRSEPEGHEPNPSDPPDADDPENPPGPPAPPEPPDPPDLAGPTAASKTNPERQPDPGLIVFRSRKLPAAAIALPARKLPQPGITSPAATLDDLNRKILTDPGQIRAAFPDGHGGFTQPPPGALTYQPSDLLAAAVRLRDGTCRHPGCTVPASDCQIDHIVAFLKANPALGGWTILANLQCLCVLHHQLKTAGLWHHDMLTGAIMHIYNTIGQHALTLPVRR
ncbi:DUF222 domain-containing protein [Rhodococcus sp. NPDC058514]|uniref:HNH endonuclease signature motif containing protein n=1 Tax=unclassified Rhodococcus (in: high G+C Gram-positive bacteria) TaxID=192944 RepID=UPI003656515F